jgi:DEAD/DEAH box helicase
MAMSVFIDAPPPRELAFQIADQFAVLGAPLNVRTAVIVGGMNMMVQAIELERRPHVVVATPGRMVVGNCRFRQRTQVFITEDEYPTRGVCFGFTRFDIRTFACFIRVSLVLGLVYILDRASIGMHGVLFRPQSECSFVPCSCSCAIFQQWLTIYAAQVAIGT